MKGRLSEPACTCNFCVTGERDGLGHDDGPRAEPFVSFGDDIDPSPEPWNCVDCGIPLEPGMPPICEECVDS